MFDVDKKENDRFVYQKNDIEIKNSQCDFCKYNTNDNKNICEKLPNGKPEEIIQSKKRCEYLDLNN